MDTPTVTSLSPYHPYQHHRSLPSPHHHPHHHLPTPLPLHPMTCSLFPSSFPAFGVDVMAGGGGEWRDHGGKWACTVATVFSPVSPDGDRESRGE